MIRASKSQPKLKISLSKYSNFFAQKKWDDPMYMDDRNAETQDNIKTLVSYSSMMIQPRAKLSYSLHDKVGAVLADSRKIGMIEKVDNPSTRRSLAKISYVSTLPPIKTQVQETEEYLRKIKNQLNEVSLKSIKMSKQVSNLQASITQTIQKSRVLEQILGRTGKKQQQQIQDKKQITQWMRHDYEVRLHMHETIKSDTRVLAKCKHQMEQKLKVLKVELQSLTTQLNNSMANLNSNLYTKQQYQSKQQLASEQLMIKSQIAQNKLTLERNAQKTHRQIQQIQGYNQQQFHYETNLNNHFSTLKQLRAQQVLQNILSVLFNKYQLGWQKEERAYGLMKMYASLGDGFKKMRISVKTESTSKERELRNSSIASITSQISTGSKQGSSQADLASVYQSSFKDKTQLQAKIQEKEKIIKQLEQKKQKITKKWIQKSFEDGLNQGNKVVPRQTDFSKEIKKLIERQKRAEKNKIVQAEVEVWLARQGQKLNFAFSKKLSSGQKIQKIIQYVRSEAQNLQNKPIQPVKHTPIQKPKQKNSKTKK